MAGVSKDGRPVVGLGQCSWDILGLIPSWPGPDDKCETTGLTMQGGGPVATALFTVARLGLPAAFIGIVGDDHYGPLIRQGLADNEVDTSRLRTVPGGQSQIAFIAVAPEAGTRAIFWQRGTPGDFKPDDEDMALIRSARLLHLDGLMLKASLAAAREARRAGVPVVYDAGTLRGGCLKLVALTDYLICSKKFMAAFQPNGNLEKGLARLTRLGPSQAVVTLGAEGSLGYDGKTYYRQAALSVKVVDTTGAGDVYHGGFLCGLSEGWDMPSCMEFASAIAGIKCTALGGRTAIPGRDRALRLREPEENS